jgi:hypothetical protein
MGEENGGAAGEKVNIVTNIFSPRAFFIAPVCWRLYLQQ